MSLAVEKNLEPVLDPPKKAIGVIHDASFIGGEATDLFELVNGQQGIGAADLGILAAVQQLQKLDHELDRREFHRAPVLTSKSAPRRDLLFDPPLQRLDLRDLAGTQVAAVDERGDGLDKRASQAEIAGDRTALDQGLALPRSTPGLVVAQGRVQRTGQRTLFAVGAKPHVNPVGNAPRGVFGEQPDDFGSHPCEELGVRDDSRPRGAAILVIEEDKIDVGAVVQLSAAELAQAQDDEPGGAAIGPHAGRTGPRPTTAPARVAASVQASARFDRSSVITSKGRPRTMSL